MGTEGYRVMVGTRVRISSCESLSEVRVRARVRVRVRVFRLGLGIAPARV